MPSARAHHHQQPEVAAATLKAVAAGGGDEDHSITGQQHAVRAEYDLCALGVHHHQVRMGPQRLGREWPHGLLATPNVSPTPPQGHVQAVVAPHVLQPCLVGQVPHRQAHRQGEAFLGLGRPDITGVVTQDRRIPQLDAPDVAVVRGPGHQVHLPGDVPWALELVALQGACQHPCLPLPRTHEAVSVGTFGRMVPAVPLLTAPQGRGRYRGGHGQQRRVRRVHVYAGVDVGPGVVLVHEGQRRLAGPVRLFVPLVLRLLLFLRLISGCNHHRRRVRSRGEGRQRPLVSASAPCRLHRVQPCPQVVGQPRPAGACMEVHAVR